MSDFERMIADREADMVYEKQLEAENAKLRDLIHRIQPVLYELYQGYANVMSLSDEDTSAYIDVMTFDNPAIDESESQ